MPIRWGAAIRTIPFFGDGHFTVSRQGHAEKVAACLEIQVLRIRVAGSGKSHAKVGPASQVGRGLQLVIQHPRQPTVINAKRRAGVR